MRRIWLPKIASHGPFLTLNQVEGLCCFGPKKYKRNILFHESTVQIRKNSTGKKTARYICCTQLAHQQMPSKFPLRLLALQPALLNILTNSTKTWSSRSLLGT